MLFTIVQYSIVLALCGVAIIYLFVIVFSHSPREPFPSELTYLTADSGPRNLPLVLTAPATLKLSVVIPCYNETQRLGPMLEEAIAHLEAHYRSDYELILVDDGSSDGTIAYALEFAKNVGLAPNILKCVKLERNRGKGGAVKHGLMHCSGKYALFADADGASKFSDVDRLVEAAYVTEPAIAIGSRAHMVNTDAVVKRSFVRNFLMYSLHTLVYVFGIREIKDTQCGFKLFNRAAVAKVLPNLHTERWIFDVEILILARRLAVPIREVGISWHEVGGSKVDLARDSINMAIDLVVIRMAYLLGVYKDNKGVDLKKLE
ncbi:glycosyltransferase family 2 protein [Babjeviella inositovora NRRL Y-12698]|uniref:dolichyl-phosphate beta-glucosyltransferase n=1 Tax=Babjeviella inositovora NRRL Y-12698 TaxID=984486 RepID=A0A1E3QN10_9ASCO|nr:glycosyltransferase family 2 protein [Babjeviella inositovora NRRL Y-12698]ODQ78844.1 glycosyltransferase family 2 protein [Babjeviella inositovora NRRL Y-12698]